MSGKKLERRAFIQTCSIAALGNSLLFNVNPLIANENDKKKNVPFELSKPRWIIYENGTYDLISKEVILKNCRPSINGQGVMPKNVFLGDSPKGKRIVYELPEGFLMLDLKTNKDSLSIGAELSGFSQAPRWFFPISQAEVFGVTRFFKQGFGTGGDTNVYDIPKLDKLQKIESGKKNWSQESYLTFAFLGENETLAIGNIDHNDFLQRSTIYNRPYLSGLYNTDVDYEQIFFEAGMLLEEISIENEYIKLPELHFFAGNKPFETIQELTWYSSEETRARQSSITSFHWLSNNGNQGINNFNDLQKQINYLNSLNPKLPVQSLIINKGYCEIGDWLEFNVNWPGEYDRAAREIFKDGYRAGIWLAPFAMSETSKLFSQHPEWILRDYKDIPIRKTTEGGKTGYVLDISHPGVQKYLQKVFRTLRKAGFIFYETAYMDWGLTDSWKVKRASSGKTSVQIFREMLQLIRDEIGMGSLWMMDEIPYFSAIGFADIVKTSKTSELKNFETIIKESYFTQYFNNIFWQNNPGYISFATQQNGFNEHELVSLALWNGILGGAVEISDEITSLEKDQLKFYRFLEPNKRQQNATLPFWPDQNEIKVAVRFYKQHDGWGVLLLNDKNLPVFKSFQVSDLIEEESAFIFDWKPDGFNAFGKLSEIQVELNTHQSKLFYLCKKNEPPPEDLTLGGKTTVGL